MFPNFLKSKFVPIYLEAERIQTAQIMYIINYNVVQYQNIIMGIVRALELIMEYKIVV